jgi:signal transduction histidine kinase
MVKGEEPTRIEKVEEKLEQRTRNLEEEVKKRSQQLFELYRGIAIAEERNRLAQEIHDGLAQTLATSLLKIELCERVIDNNPKQVRNGLKELREILVKGIKATRQVIFDLHLPEVHRTGFATILKQYLEEFHKKTGIKYFLRLNLKKTLPMKTQVGTYRIIREAMNNVRKHSGTTDVDLRLRTDRRGNLHLTMQDNGKGFNVKKVLTQSKYTRQFGLKGMEEQAKLLGGTFLVRSVKGQGTRIEVKIPLRG